MIIADECTDPLSNQEILSLCLRFVDQSTPHDPHVKECLISFMHLERTNATMISRKILESLSDPSISLDPSTSVVRHMMELPLCQVERKECRRR